MIKAAESLVVGPAKAKADTAAAALAIAGSKEFYSPMTKRRLTKSEAALLRAWIAALRSGDYKQGKGRLRTINKAKKDCLEWSDLFQIKYLVNLNHLKI